jgi:HK97 family phage portal protein
MPGERTRDGDAMGLSAFYACVTLLSDIIASFSLKAYRIKDGVQVPVDPQPTLFRNGPWPEVTWFAWLWMMMESTAITGNGFGYIASHDDYGLPASIMPVHPDFVSIVITDFQGKKWPKPMYTILGSEVPKDDMLHIKRYPQAGFAWGMSPVQKAAATIGLGLAAQKYGYRYFNDSANPSGILTTEQDLTEAQAKREMKKWIQSHGGRRLPAVMSGGLEWQPISITPEESQFLQTRANQVSEVARYFRIPPHMIGDSTKATSWGSGIENLTLGFVKFTLWPWLTAIEQEVTRLLPRSQVAKFDIDELMRGDVQTRWESYRIGRDTGAYSANDILKMEGRKTIGAIGDIRLQPANFVPLGTPPPANPSTQDPQPAIKPFNKPKPADNTDDGEDTEN